MIRRAELEAVVASALGVEPGHVTRDMAAGLARQHAPGRQPPAPGWLSLEEQLMRAVLSSPGGANGGGEGGGGGDGAGTLHDFVRGWREVFCEALQPRHLPPGWSTEHRRPVRPAVADAAARVESETAADPRERLHDCNREIESVCDRLGGPRSV